MYICICNAITERQIKACAEERACTLADLERCLGVGTACGRCKHAAKQVLSDIPSDSRSILPGAPA